MNNRRNFLTQLTAAGTGAMLLGSQGSTALASSSSNEDIEEEEKQIAGGAAEWQMISGLKGNNEIGIQTLDFAIQFETNRQYYLRTQKIDPKDLKKLPTRFDKEININDITESSEVLLCQKSRLPLSDMPLFIIVRYKSKYPDEYYYGEQISTPDMETKHTVAFTGGEVSIQCVNYLLTVNPTLKNDIERFIES